MSKLHWLLATAWLVGSALSVGAQETSLRPRLDDQRLWSPTNSEVAPPSIGNRYSPFFEGDDSDVGGTTRAAAYLMGALAGLRLAEVSTPPRELGLWLRGWYEGVAIPGPLDQPGVAARTYDVPPASTSHGGPDGAVVHAIVRGFLDALATTARE